MPSKDEILRRTNNGLDVFRHYLPGQWRIGCNFLNPLYEDRRASSNVFFDRRGGCYRIKDFVEILQIINRDLNLGLSDDSATSFATSVPSISQKSAVIKELQPRQPENVHVPPNSKSYSIEQKSFSTSELSFWMQYGITPEILKTYRVSSLREFRSDNREGKPFTLHSSGVEPLFGYTGKRHVKIYRPNSEIRFLYGGVLPDNYCFGLEQLPAKGDTLFITGREKDVMTLAAHGLHAICFNSETSHIPQSVIKKLSYRFKHIILLYDTDKTGLESSAKHQQQLSELGVKRLVLPLAGTKQEKDISDYFRLDNTRENFITLFIEFLDNLYLPFPR